MDTIPNTNNRVDVDDLLDFLGESPSSNTNTTTTTQSAATISNVDLFDSLCDFSDYSIIPDAQTVPNYDNSTAPDLLLDVSSSYPQTDSFVMINDDDLFGDSISTTIAETTQQDDIDELDFGVSSTLSTQEQTPNISVDPMINDEETLTNDNCMNEESITNGDVENQEFNFDVIELPSSSELGLGAQHFKGQIAKKGSYALRRKPSRKGVRSILPNDENNIYIDSTEPKEEVTSRDEDESTETSETVEEEAPIAPTKTSKPAFVMPGLHDLKKSKLFAKTQTKSDDEDEDSTVYQNTDSEISKPPEADVVKENKPVGVRVLPTLPKIGGRTQLKTGVRVLPTIPTSEEKPKAQEDEQASKPHENERKPFEMENKRSSLHDEGFSDDMLFGGMNETSQKTDVPKNSGMLTSKIIEEKKQKESELVEKNESFTQDIPVSITSIAAAQVKTPTRSPSPPPSIKPLPTIDNPPVIPNRLSLTRKELPPSPEKTQSSVSKTELVSKRNSLNAMLLKDDEESKKTFQTVESELKTKNSFNDSKEDLGKNSSFSDTNKDFGNSFDDIKVTLRNTSHTSNTPSYKRHTIHLETGNTPAKLYTKEEKRSSICSDPQKTDSPSNLSSWLTEPKLKKPPPLSEKNGGNRNNSNNYESTSAQDTDSKTPSGFKEMHARKSRVKPDSSNNKINEDQKPAKPAKPARLATKLTKTSKVGISQENENQENGDIKEKINPSVQLRKPTVEVHVESKRKSFHKEYSSQESNDSNEKITSPWLSNIKLRKTPSPAKEAARNTIEPEWKRKAEEKRARFLKSGLLDQ
ncbi:uncharacterized protein LOC126823213 [Patella vulgata]|uniref:uncharacterized protein LOC126823213 n=1 Tax=Patella vulgata TaxID=6465 RepID=UPI0024A937D0|nr:uncharacterized protein LOC126823213 [Patella vulgata]XP_050407827.2 uncharacterized protein LOC126823213 [Patella vulgata]XP_050407828.2 uncharacterized protein LOC126823213 [Patella vulgata]